MKFISDGLYSNVISFTTDLNGVVNEALSNCKELIHINELWYNCFETPLDLHKLVEKRLTSVLQYSPQTFTVAMSTANTSIIDYLFHIQLIKERYLFWELLPLDVFVNHESTTGLSSDDLIQVDKLSSLNGLVSGIAHEINNPNNLILLNSTFLFKVWKELLVILDAVAEEDDTLTIRNLPYDHIREELSQMLDSVISGSKRIKDIVKSLSQFVSVEHNHRTNPVDLRTVIDSAIFLTKNMVSKSTRFFSYNAPDTPFYLQINSQPLQQIIVNVIGNSCQALRSPDDAISIELESDSNVVSILVRDTGEGIDPKNLAKIFEPFFTTRRENGNKGLGLTVAYNIVRSFNGNIEFESEVDKGTTVKISLPVFEKTGPVNSYDI